MPSLKDLLYNVGEGCCMLASFRFLPCGVQCILAHVRALSSACTQAVFKRTTTYVPFLLVGSYFTNEVSMQESACVHTHAVSACAVPPTPVRTAGHLLHSGSHRVVALPCQPSPSHGMPCIAKGEMHTVLPHQLHPHTSLQRTTSLQRIAGHRLGSPELLEQAQPRGECRYPWCSISFT